MIVQVLRWVRAHKSSAAGLALVVLGCYALLSLSKRVQHLGARRSAVVARAAPPTAAASLASPSIAVQEPVPQAVSTAAMRAAFDRAASYDDFIRQAAGRPEQGGRFYALLAWKRCAAVRPYAVGAKAGGPGGGAFRNDVLALVLDLEGRCVRVLDDWPDIDALYKPMAAQGGDGDVLLPPDGRGVATPARRETAEADVEAALRSGDPLAAAALLRANAGLLDAGNSTGDPAVDRRLREKAGEVAACELAGDCRGGLAAALYCLESGDYAHDDWRDIVIAQVPESQRIIFDTMLAALRQRAGLAPAP